MNRTLSWMLSAALAFGLPSCSLFHGPDVKGAKKEKKPQSKLVGRIASVSADGKFVMIQSYGAWEVAAGNILTTQGSDQRVANLRCSGEKLGQYAAADIQAGLPQPGDAVFYSPAEPSKSGSPGTQAAPDGFTPSLNSGSGSPPLLPQFP